MIAILIAVFMIHSSFAMDEANIPSLKYIVGKFVAHNSNELVIAGKFAELPLELKSYVTVLKPNIDDKSFSENISAVLDDKLAEDVLIDQKLFYISSQQHGCAQIARAIDDRQILVATALLKVGFRGHCPITLTGTTNLHLAAKINSVFLCKWLLANGLRLKQADGYGVNAWVHAVCNGATDVIDYFLELQPEKLNGFVARLFLKTPLEFDISSKMTPLMLAVAFKKLELCRILLDKQADPNIIGDWGFNAYSFASIKYANDKDYLQKLSELLERYGFIDNQEKERVKFYFKQAHLPEASYAAASYAKIG